MLKMQSAKEIKLLEGVIGMAEWTMKWPEIHNNKQQ